MKKLTKNKTPVVLTGVGLTALAAVPGTAEAHCGHGMYGAVYYNYWQFGYPYYGDSGCVGKGGQPDAVCLHYDPPNCDEGYWYYNCYQPC
jgi:hypothetical protein